MSECWFAAYSETLDFYRDLGVGSDVHMVLDVEPKQCLERIKKRARSEEVSVSLQYLEELKTATLEALDGIRVLKIKDKSFHTDDREVSELAKIILSCAVAVRSGL